MAVLTYVCAVPHRLVPTCVLSGAALCGHAVHPVQAAPPTSLRLPAHRAHTVHAAAVHAAVLCYACSARDYQEAGRSSRHRSRSPSQERDRERRRDSRSGRRKEPHVHGSSSEDELGGYIPRRRQDPNRPSKPQLPPGCGSGGGGVKGVGGCGGPSRCWFSIVGPATKGGCRVARVANGRGSLRTWHVRPHVCLLPVHQLHLRRAVVPASAGSSACAVLCAGVRALPCRLWCPWQLRRTPAPVTRHVLPSSSFPNPCRPRRPSRTHTCLRPLPPPPRPRPAQPARRPATILSTTSGTRTCPRTPRKVGGGKKGLEGRLSAAMPSLPCPRCCSCATAVPLLQVAAAPCQTDARLP